MGPGAWSILIAAIVLEVIGTTALKATEGFSRLWPSVLVLICYGGVVWLLALAVRTLPVGVVYAIWSGLGIVLISLASYFVYGQKLDLAAMIGLGMIIAGVVVVQVFSKVV